MYISCGTENGRVEDGVLWVSRNGGCDWTKIFHMPFTEKVTTAV